MTAHLYRVQRPASIEEPLARLLDERVMVTGADGSIGVNVVRRLRTAGVQVLATDLASCDVTRRADVYQAMLRFDATVVLHLAGDKHAPAGETRVGDIVDVNVTGTRNVIATADECGARVVVASTCKAADPETAYGASKLIAERVALTAGHTVARFYNVVETTGNVFELWAADYQAGKPIKAMPCHRYFISLDEAVSLLLNAAILEPGRYTIDPGPAVFIPDLARRAFPDANIVEVPRRRGDRLVEPRHAASEHLVRLPRGIERIVSYHDDHATVPFDRLVAA